MKRLPLIALSLGVAFCGLALAQQQTAPTGTGATPPPASNQHMHKFDAQTQLQRLTKQLQLSADQQSQIGPMLQQRDQQLQSLHDDASLKPADRRAKVMSIMQDSETQIGGVLTPAQRDKWKAMREKAIERAQEKHGQNVPSAPGSSGG
jgi:periplasmic protein CpxP/Spy